MFQRLLGRRNTANRAVIDALYGQIVAAARQPVLYSDWEVPDTPLGRFEMLALHVFLVLHRLRGEAGAARRTRSGAHRPLLRRRRRLAARARHRRLGVPKRMKKLARMFYGRAAAYGEALDRGDARGAGRCARPQRRVRGSPDWRGAEPLAGYALRAAPRPRRPVRAERSPRAGFTFRAAGTTLEGKSSIPMKDAAASPLSFLAHVGRLPHKGMPVRIDADERQRAALAAAHGLLAVHSFRADLLVKRWKRNGVKVSGTVEADIVQACVVTLEPLAAQISEPVSALFLPAEFQARPSGLRGRRRSSARCGRARQPRDFRRRHHRRRRARGGVLRAWRSTPIRAARGRTMPRRTSPTRPLRPLPGSPSSRSVSLASALVRRECLLCRGAKPLFSPSFLVATPPRESVRPESRVIRISIDAMGGDHGPR